MFKQQMKSSQWNAVVSSIILVLIFVNHTYFIVHSRRSSFDIEITLIHIESRISAIPVIIISMKYIKFTES